MANETTTKFKVDISELKRQFQDASRQIRVVNSEFKAATAGMDDWSNSADGISAKTKQLNSVLESQKDQLKSLEDQYGLVAKEQGENSKGAQELLIKINNQKAAIGKTEAELKKYTARLDEIGDSSDDAADGQEELKSAFDSLADEISDQQSELDGLKKSYVNLVLEQGKESDEAKQTAKQIEKLSGELKDNKTQAKNAEDAADDLDQTMDDLGESAKDASDGFTVLKGALSNLLASGVKTLISGITSGISTLANLGEETKEYRNNMAKLNTAFKEAGTGANAAKNTYEQLYAVLGDDGQSVEAANHLAELADNQKDLKKWTTICTGVYAKFGDSLPIEGLTEAANETVKTGKVTGNLADALNWTTMSSEEWADSFKGHPKALAKFQKALENGETAEDAFNEAMTECNTEAEREQILRQALTNLYGESAKSYQENNKSVIEANKAQAKYTETLAKLGAKVEPIMTKVKTGFTKVLEAALEFVNGVDFDAVGVAIDNAFAYLIDTIFPAIQTGFQWILDNKDVIIAGLAGIAAGFVAFNVVSIIQGVVSAFKAFKAAQEGATVAQWLLNAAMNANPIGLLIAAIVGLVAAFVVLWNKSEAFRNFWIGLWNTISGFVSSSWNSIKTWCETNIPQIIDSIVTFFSELPGKIWTWLTTTYDNVVSWGSDMWAKAQEVGSTFVDSVVEFFAGLPEKIWSWLTTAYENVTTWASDMVTKAGETGEDFVEKIIEFIQELPGKIWDWLSNAYGKVVLWAANMKTKAIEAGKNFVDKVIEYIKELPDKIWNWVSKAYDKVTTWASDMKDKAAEAGKDFLDEVIKKVKELPDKVWDWLSKAAEKVVKWGSDLAKKGKEAAEDLYDAVVDGIKGLPDKIKSIGSDIVEGLWNGISDMGGWIGGKIQGFGDGVLSSLKNFFGIASPSKLMRDEVGKYLAQGIAVGIEKNAKSAINATRTMSEQIMSEAGNVNLFDDVNINKSALSRAKSSINKSGMSGMISNGNLMSGNQSGTTYNQTFNQYNSSPKSLSRLEIYRQTKNQLNFAKGVGV